MEEIWDALQREIDESKKERISRITENETPEKIPNFEKIEYSTYQDNFKNAVLCITSESSEAKEIIAALDQVSRIAQISAKIPKEIYEKCWLLISSDNDELSEAASKCLYDIFRFNNNAEFLYGEELPSKLVILFQKERMTTSDRNLFLRVALSTPSSRELCVTDELTDILISKAKEAPDADTLASVLEIIIDIYSLLPSIQEAMPEFLASIEDKFSVEDNRVYFAFLNSVYLIVTNSSSEEFLCSFCESEFFCRVVSSLSIDSLLSAKIIINIMHAMIGKGNNIHCVRIHKALVGANVFNVIRTILLSDIEDLHPYCYNISADLFNNVEEFRAQFFSSELPGALIERFPEMTSKTKKSVIRFLAYVAKFAVSNDDILQYFIENEILILISDDFDFNEVISFAVVLIKQIIIAGMKRQGTEIYDAFFEQITNDDFCDSIESKIDELSEFDSGDEDDKYNTATYNRNNESIVQELYEINSIIEKLKSQ